MTRAALYIRLSEETDTTTSPERQRQAASAYAVAKGWTVVGTFEDIDVSATHRRLERPGLARLREEVAAERVDVVIVYRLDRLARNVLDSLTLLDEWRRTGVAVVSTTESIDATTPHGKAMFTLVAVFAEMEAAAISERVKGSVDRLRRAGRYAGGNVPYGYAPADNPAGPGRVLVVNDDEAAILREAADRLLRGQTLYRIANDLTRRGVVTRRAAYARAELTRLGPLAPGAAPDENRTRLERYAGTTWSVQALTQMLASPTIVGRVIHGGAVLTDDDGMPATVWPPVLDHELWSRVRAALNVDVPKPARPAQRRRRARLLSGLLRCAICGKAMYTKTDGRGKVAYSCATISRGRADVCPGNSVGADLIDDYVSGLYLDSYGDQEMFERRVVAGRGVDVAEVERAIREIGEALNEVDPDTEEESRLLLRQRDLKVRRGALRAAPSTRTVTLVPTGVTHRQAWDDAAEHLDDRRALLAAIFPSMTVSKGTRGRRGLDTSRVRIIAQPMTSADAADPEHFTAGAPAFVVDPDDLDVEDFAEVKG